jgi:WXXGXW repeat (2 copies)
MNSTNAIRNLFLPLTLAASVFAASAYAQISISIAPPAPQYEVVPIVPAGYVWAPGYWGWTGERHVWVGGRAILQREGYRWEPDRWEQRDRAYYRTAGHWERENDGRDDGNGDNDNNGKHGRGDRGRR